MTLSADHQPRYPDLDGTVAVVTGGSRGIGAATARALAANGAGVAIIARDQRALAAVAAGIGEDGGRALAVRADCTVEADLERAARDDRRAARTAGDPGRLRRRRRRSCAHRR